MVFASCRVDSCKITPHMYDWIQMKLLSLHIWIFCKADLNTDSLAHLFMGGDGKVRSHPSLNAEVLAWSCLKDDFTVIGILFCATNVLCLPIRK